MESAIAESKAYDTLTQLIYEAPTEWRETKTATNAQRIVGRMSFVIPSTLSLSLSLSAITRAVLRISYV